MSETRKNHLTIDGGLVKEDDKEYIGSYKPISQGHGDFPKSPSKKSVAKEPDGASERLLQETDHAKIATRIDMTDAKYVVGGDRRNGDAKVELDANRRVLCSIQLLANGGYQRQLGQDHAMCQAQTTISSFLDQFLSSIYNRSPKSPVHLLPTSESSYFFIHHERPSKRESRKRRHRKREKREDKDKPTDDEDKPTEEIDKNVPVAEEVQGPSGTQDVQPRYPEKLRHRKKKTQHHGKHKPKEEEVQPQEDSDEPPSFTSQETRRMSFFPGTFNADDDSERPPSQYESVDQARAAIAAFLKRFEEDYVQFSGLTKEELVVYQDDPFWVRLRWTLFILFWLLWLCMLAGAITIIIRAPKCSQPKTWYMKGPLVDMTNYAYGDVERNLPIMKTSKVEAVLVKADSYAVLDNADTSIETFKKLLVEAKKFGVKLIVELIPNYVSINSTWFIQSENRSQEYDTYFNWANGSGYDEQGNLKPPNKWVAPTNKPAWQYSDVRGQYYLRQFDENTADLNFANDDVVKHFDDVLKHWMEAGAAGVRLRHARHLFFYPKDGKLVEETEAPAREAGAADHTMYRYWRHEHTRDLPPLQALLQRWALRVQQLAVKDTADSVLTVAEDGSRWARGGSWALRPLSAEAELADPRDLPALTNKLKQWPTLQLKSGDSELALFSLLLPATPLLNFTQLEKNDNETGISYLVSLRSLPSLAEGQWLLEEVNSTDTQPLVAIVRWKAENTGFVGIYNPWPAPAHAVLDRAWAPADLNVYHVSKNTQNLTNYTTSTKVHSENVLVPAKSTVVLSFTPKTSTEK